MLIIGGMVKEFKADACPRCGGTGDTRAVNPAWLKERRQRANVTLKKLADSLGFSAAYLCDIEFGRRAVSAQIHDAYRALPGPARGTRSRD
jgi:hypothetical protein